MNKKIKKWLVPAIIAAAIVSLADALFLEKFFFEVRRYRIGKKGSGKKIRIVFLTDLHFKKSLWSYQRKLAGAINKMAPDVILISGDVIDENGIYATAKEFFSLLPYSIPKIAIMGNHDYKNRVRLDTYKQLYKQNNCTLLINKSQSVNVAGSRLMVTGADDFIEGHSFFASAVSGVGREENHVLLVHSPLQQEEILKEIAFVNSRREEHQQLNIQYIFAGHNHGGQVRFFGFAPILPKMAGNYLNGWYNSAPPYLYVSKVFGTSTVPFRFGARSEVTVFEMGV